MGGETDIKAIHDQIDSLKTFMETQFNHGKAHFERLESDNSEFKKIIEKHQGVFNGLNEGVLEGVNERAAFVDAMMDRSKFWKDIRDELTRKGVMVICLCVLAGIIFMFGFEDLAKKVMQWL